MDERILKFLAKDRIAVLTTILATGVPHSASLHYASEQMATGFLFGTERQSRKCSHFEIGKRYPASLVVGFSEQEFVEFQAEGEVYIVGERDELDKFWGVYAEKYNGAKEDETGKSVLLRFVPKWWRYTEFKPKYFKLES